MYAIYALIDPRDRSVHYVGMTDNVYKRFLAHLQGAEGNQEKNAWVDELKALNKMIIMETLEEMQGQEQAKGREAYWIKHFSTLGHPLTNRQRNSLWEGKAEVSKEMRKFIKRARARGISHHNVAYFAGLDGNDYHVYRQVCAEEGVELGLEVIEG